MRDRGEDDSEDDVPESRKRRVVAPRLDEYVEQMLAGMYSYTETVDTAAKHFEVDPRTVQTAIQRVRSRWQKAEETTLEQRRAKFRARCEQSWREAQEAGDYRAAAAFAKVLADIEGVKAPKKVEHSGVVGLRPVAAMAPQDRNREIAELLAKRKALDEGRPAESAIEPTPSLDLGIDEEELSPDIRAPERISLPTHSRTGGKADDSN